LHSPLHYSFPYTTLFRSVVSFDLSRDFSSRMMFDWHVPAFTMAISLAATVMFGLAPALHCAKTDVLSALKDGEATAPIQRSRLRDRKSTRLNSSHQIISY